MRLRTLAGRIVDLSGVEADQRRLGALWAQADQGVSLTLQRLLRLNASTHSGDLNINVAGSEGAMLTVDSLQTDPQAGAVLLDAGLNSLAISAADQITADTLSLNTAQGLRIDTPQPVTLQARTRMTLSCNNLQTDPNRLTLASSGIEGTLELKFNQLALADALPQLPLLRADVVVLAGRGGLRLTDQSFNDQQISSPVNSLLFSSATAARQGITLAAPDAAQVPARWPYERVPKTQLLENDAGVPYILRSVPGLPAGSAPQPFTHYQPDAVNAAGYPYLYQAILRSLDGSAAAASGPVIQFRSNEKLLTSGNLAQIGRAHV